MAKTRVTDKQDEAIKKISELIAPMEEGGAFLSNVEDGFKVVFKATGKNGKNITYEMKDLTAEEFKALIRADLKKKATEITKLAKTNDLVLEDKETELVESFK